MRIYNLTYNSSSPVSLEAVYGAGKTHVATVENGRPESAPIPGFTRVQVLETLLQKLPPTLAKIEEPLGLVLLVLVSHTFQDGTERF